MPTKKKKFIDKKKAVSFRVIHRSQRDPLAVDENAPQHVLIPTGFPAGHLASSEDKDQRPSKDDVEKRREEQRKYGVYFEDDYDYLQHLKDVSTVPEWEPIVERVRISKDDFPVPSGTSSGNANQENVTLKLPSSVFPSTVEEEEGFLYRKPTHGPHPEWDPDVVAALDDDFDFDDPDNQLEDDFITLANEGDENQSDHDDDDDDDDFEMDDEDADFGSDDDSYGSDRADGSDEDDEKPSFRMPSWQPRSSKSHYSESNYSLTSSVIPRSEALQTLDERFEKMLEAYDDAEIGALDGEEITGFLDPNHQMVTHLAEEFQKMGKCTLKKFHDEERTDDMENRNGNDDSEEETSDIEEYEKKRLVEIPKEEQYDCESIISTYSNLYNHPKLICEPKLEKGIKISRKTGMPLGILNQSGLTKQNLKMLDAEEQNRERNQSCEEVRSRVSRLSMASTVRSKNETPEERRARKAEVKMYRRERRLEKKVNQLAFKEEEKRQKQMLQNKRSGIKLT